MEQDRRLGQWNCFAASGSRLRAGRAIAFTAPSRRAAMSDDHAHPDDHAHGSELSEMDVRVRSLETVLTEKGYVDPAALDKIVEAFETRIGPHNGARIVARAWTDPEFKRRLLADATEAANSLGNLDPVASHLIAVENTLDTHNLVVCTLCSCYPWSVLGLPPVWYKSAAYRSRSVIDPLGVLREFGLQLADDVEVRVWDSIAEMRYLVLPERPAGSEKMTEEELAALVTRDSMVGVAKVALSGAQA